MNTILPISGDPPRAFWAYAAMWDAHMAVEVEDRVSDTCAYDDWRCRRAQRSMQKAAGR